MKNPTFDHPKSLYLCVALFAASFFLAGCYDPLATAETPMYAAEARADTLSFGLPSTEVFYTIHAAFKDGKKAKDYNIAPNVYADATVQGAGASTYSEASPSLIRKWSVIHNTFTGEYQLRSGPYSIWFYGKYDKMPPTVSMLRQIFGKWIIFQGDDMSRVHEVSGETFRGGGGKVLVFNDGRAPADTFKPDY